MAVLNPAPFLGPHFFAAVTVSLAVDVSPDKGGSAPVDREEDAYQKLVSLFGLEPSVTGRVPHHSSQRCCDDDTLMSVIHSLKMPFCLPRFVQ